MQSCTKLCKVLVGSEPMGGLVRLFKVLMCTVQLYQWANLQYCSRLFVSFDVHCIMVQLYWRNFVTCTLF